MPRGYEKMRDKFAKTMSYASAQSKEARIWNSQHPGNPVGAHREPVKMTRQQKSRRRKYWVT